MIIFDMLEYIVTLQGYYCSLKDHGSEQFHGVISQFFDSFIELVNHRM